MNVPLPQTVPEHAAGIHTSPAAPNRPTWAGRLGVAAVLFIAAGVLIAAAALLANPLRNADVFSAGAALVAAGAVLRSITSSPAGN